MSSNRHSSSDEERERSPSKNSRSKPSQGSGYRKNSSQSHKEERDYHRERGHRRSRSGSDSRKADRSRSKNSGSRRRSRSRSPRRYRDRSGDRKKHNKSSDGHDQGSSSNLPNFLNPLSGNSRYAEQLAKRKMLWNNKKSKEEDNTKQQSIWQGAKFSQDQDGKLTAKFQRLMGMKETQKTDQQSDGKVKDLFKKQEELFSSMEMQYEVARATTHTQRGVGLGFGPRHIP